MGIVAFGGFELGDLSDIRSTFGTVGAGSGTKRTGDYAGGSTIGAGGGMYTYRTSATEFWWRVYQHIIVSANPSAPVVSTLLGNEGPSGDNLAVVFTFNTDGSVTAQLQYNRSGGSGTNVGSSFSVPTGQWDLWEAHILASNPNSVVEVKLNGVVKATGTGLTLNSTSDFDSLRMGIPANDNGLGGAVWFDDWMLSTSSYLGPGQCIARKVKSGTPTYNAFTKQGGGAISAEWADLPFSATNNARSTAADQAQTALVDDVAAGTDPIGASDTINACKVAMIAKKI